MKYTDQVEEFRELSQWWAMQSEQYRKSLISDIPNCLAYGITKSVHLLPKAASDRIAKTYAERTIECSICRREIPINEYESHSHPCE